MKRKKLKTMGLITPFMNHYTRNGKMEDTDPLSRYVMLAKLTSITCIEFMLQYRIRVVALTSPATSLI